MNQKISTGNPFLDKILNGGFIPGSIILLEEDNPTKIYESIIKYSISEGLINNNRIYFYYNNNSTCSSIINNLPYKSTQVESILNSKSKEINSTTETEMKIAWRYENINYTNLLNDLSKDLKYIFDLSRILQDNLYNKDNLRLIDVSKLISNEGNSLKNILLNFIHSYQEYASSFTDKDNDKYCKVFIPNIFKFENYEDLNEISIWLKNLKNVARCLNGFFFISVDKSNLRKEILNLLMNISDYIFDIKPLLFEEDLNKVGDYDALFMIKKMPNLNTFKCQQIETDSFGIIRDKRKIIIEKIDIGVEVDRNTKVKEEQIDKLNKNKIEYEK
ncbi:MAG: hypothetical protein MJ252_12885 [archaeon]|nr:hypothetical protein [archaeon]